MPFYALSAGCEPEFITLFQAQTNAGFKLCSAVYFWYPEVKGMTLEDIREVFNHGFGVKYARGVQKEMVRQKKAQVESQTGVTMAV